MPTTEFLFAMIQLFAPMIIIMLGIIGYIVWLETKDDYSDY